MSLTKDNYIDKVYYAYSHGQPQPNSGVISAAIEADLPRALQRLADTTAADDGVCHLLQKSFTSLTLVGGSSIVGSSVATPSTLLTSEQARARYVLTLPGVTNPLQRLWQVEDLFQPPSMLDYYFYALSSGRIVVVNSSGVAPSETALTLVGNFVPLITEVPDELSDNLIDHGIALIAEVPSLSAQVAQTPTAVEGQ